ncbi:hypothetical protein [Arthrobacter sp. AL12]|uniref:hypothetical protein n=1 Tax=Arthrobacter sp. AL12 TaxID=3042241 RepID=UPI00249A0ECD|nr:hypothetical protein [Arthrobacter sp. AL12]MDI3214016.1 hypothetical protein [Arthrobacter sp. AL12]
MTVTATRAAIAVLVVAATSFISFFRLPQSVLDTVWAEDGPVFLRQAMSGGGPSSIFAPYEGYLHVLPRLFGAVIVRFLPVEDFAVGLAYISCLVVAVVAYLTFHCASALTGNIRVRIAWAAIPVLLSVGPYEILGNTANIHWYLLWLMPWLLLKPVRSRPEGVLLFLAALLSALTEVISLVFLPLALLHIRRKAFWPARAGLIIGAGFQIYTTLLYPRSPSNGHPLDPMSVVLGWFINMAGVVFFGSSRSMGVNIVNFGAGPVILAFLPIAASLAYLLLRSKHEQRLLALLFVTASFGLWAACLVANPGAQFDYVHFTESDWATSILTRYSAIPAMFILALFPLLADSLQGTRPRASAGVLVAFAVLLATSYFPTQVARELGPSWREGVRTSLEACVGAQDYETRPIQVSPIGWSKSGLLMPCSRLRP